MCSACSTVESAKFQGLWFRVARIHGEGVTASSGTTRETAPHRLMSRGQNRTTERACDTDFMGWFEDSPSFFQTQRFHLRIRG